MRFNAHRVMICITSQYFSLNRTLLLAIGLWPYQRSKYVRLQIILSYCILTSFAIFQLTTFRTNKCSPDLIISVFSAFTFLSFYVIQYSAFSINAHNVRNLLEQLQQICNELRNENEIAIIKKYGNSAKRFTVIITLLGGGTGLIAIASTSLSEILNIALRINGSQSRRLWKYFPEYFYNQERYFYLVLIHVYMYVVIFIGATTVIATGTMIRGCVKYVCGMFKIASYRIEHAMAIKMIKNVRLNNEISSYKEIIYAVDIHRRAMKISEYILSSFKGSLFVSFGIHVISLSLNIFKIYRTMLFGPKEELIIHIAIVISILLYMFLANYAGQELTDHNNEIFSTVYNIQWYTASLHLQKLIHFMLQRGNKTFTLNIKGMFAASLPCFATLMKASMSYFTVIYSTQQ